MSVKDDSFLSSVTFDAINQALADESERKAAIKNGNGIFGFALTNAEGKQQSWYLDLKSKGQVFRGSGPEGGKVDVTLVLSDADFSSLVSGKANAQRLFMSGKLKARGNIMKAMKIEPFLKMNPAKAKL